MGSWWNIKIGRADAPIWGKNYVSDQLMLVFRDDDRVAIDADSMVYATPAGVLRERLALQGLSSQRVRDLAVQLFDEDDEDDDRNSWPEGWDTFPTASSIVAAMTSRRGQAAAAGLPPLRRDPAMSFLYDKWQYLKECYDDPRFALSLALLSTRSSTVVKLDLSDLVVSGYMASNEHPHRDARTRLADSVAASGPVIVITEGASDSRWLRRSLEIAAPSVAHVFKFLDFDSYRAPGGTDRVVSLTKGMVSADVMNRIIAVVDNDTAGRAAARQLAGLELPGRVVVVTLPTVPYAARYPVLGPEGAGLTDVNGRAASIEFMFGIDMLLQDDETLYPVRWHSFMESENAYQGRLSEAHKREVGRRLDQVLAPAAEGVVSLQISEGCARLSKMLIDAAGPLSHLPASERSALSSWWRNDDLRNVRLILDH
ncbi:hypothetical protein [Nocardioides sp. Root140]|uniref:hypothetical protein n=1 Tax=Nocardioides sp. Root140 TaxID=1736460 RepID=UPI0006F50413|nr:hypothetical protein [Nocardioides sp. Root140]KQY61438.1 hypothetical protein ASD30_25610 [Nocardioides sp. Root140]